MTYLLSYMAGCALMATVVTVFSLGQVHAGGSMNSAGGSLSIPGLPIGWGDLSGLHDAKGIGAEGVRLV